MTPIMAAAIGGISPNLLDLAIKLTKGSPLPQFTYLIGMAIFAAMGGFVASIWGEKDKRKAFYLGIGLPSLIQLTVGTATLPENAPVENARAALEFRIFNIAYAADEIPGRTLRVRNDTGLDQLAVKFYSRDGKVSEVHAVVARDENIPVPAYAQRFQIIDKATGAKEDHELTSVPNAAESVKIAVEKNLVSGLFNALGARHVREYDLRIESVGSADR